MTWARAGCLVLVIDQVGYGERRSHPFHRDEDYRQALPDGPAGLLLPLRHRRAAPAPGRQPDGLDGLGPDARRRSAAGARRHRPEADHHPGRRRGRRRPGRRDGGARSAHRLLRAVQLRRPATGDAVTRCPTTPRPASTTWAAPTGTRPAACASAAATTSCTGSSSPARRRAASSTPTSSPGTGTATRSGSATRRSGASSTGAADDLGVAHGKGLLERRAARGVALHQHRRVPPPHDPPALRALVRHQGHGEGRVQRRRKPAELICLTDKARQELKPKSLNELMSDVGRSGSRPPASGWPASRPPSAASSSATTGASCSVP